MARARRANFDLAEAHKYFAAQCFNAAWDLIDKPDRTASDVRLMEALNQASIYDWRSRPDFSAKNTSVRILAGLADTEPAPQLVRGVAPRADQPRGSAHELGPFLLGYAHEAMARALFGLERDTEAKAHLDAAAACAQQVTRQG